MLKRKLRSFYRIHKSGVKKILFFLALCITAVAIYARQLFPVISVCCSGYLNNEVNRYINASMIDYMNNNDTGDYIEISYDDRGRITAVNAKTVEINHARLVISKCILSEIRHGSIKEVKLPIGCLFGNELTYAKGPLLSFHCISNENFTSSVESDFLEKGINQTLHKLYLVFRVDITISLPLKSITVPVECRYPISEVIIVGDVPQAYTEIHRSFDDITESEIDDINDFGAEI